MQIIIMHSRFTQARSLTLGTPHIAVAVLAFLVLTLLMGVLMAALSMRLASADVPLFRSLLPVPAAITGDAGGKERYLQENLSAMAAKLGEMEAHLIRLDALGERVQGLAGIKPEEFQFREAPGRGGPEITHAPSSGLSIEQVQELLKKLGQDIEHRSDYMNAVETQLMAFKLQSKLLPTTPPVNVAYNASGFGWRSDPFSGRSAFHEGIDFSAPTGTPIVAAAGGVVIASEYHPQFGNMIEIDHGGDLITRYAHSSKVYVKLGDIVQRGQHIADIGSTGRSTGAHLHFEVRVRDVPQNPHKFLSSGIKPNQGR